MKRFFAVLCTGIILSSAAIASEPHDASVVKGNTSFATDLYAQLSTRNGNLFFSPESISIALAMTYGGARNQTASEMAKALHFDLPPDILHPAMASALQKLTTQSPDYTLKMANALWIEKDYTLQDAFLTLVKINYSAGLNSLDFKGATEAARVTINDWVAAQTAEKITGLLAPGAVTETTRLVLTNAVYFKGAWLKAFDSAQTYSDNFHLTATQIIRVPQMHQTGDYKYFKGDIFQVLELPYKSNDLSMIIFLPDAVDGLPAFEHELNNANLQKSFAGLRDAPRVILTLPKFKATVQFTLKDVLTALGMKSAFDTSADFSGITGNHELYISDVIHKAFVDVSEEGTEAAAATALGVAGMARRDPIPEIKFCADHPFMYLIRDNRTGSILFMGRMSNPSGDN